MKSILVNLIGLYQPISYSDGSVDIIPAGLAGVDWAYVLSGLLTIVVIYSLFRLLALLFKR